MYSYALPNTIKAVRHHDLLKLRSAVRGMGFLLDEYDRIADIRQF